MTSTVDLLDLSSQLKVLADPKRLLIINLLMEGVQCNCELGDKLGMAPNLISHHLSVLRQAGLIEMERDVLDGRWIYYSINESRLDEVKAAFNGFFDPARIQPRDPACGPRGCGITMLNVKAEQDVLREVIAAVE